eukprot:CAMPEP_0177480740 /NCGR_PEP_ID=MMETSP0369-20130122/25989_1 /TAXON_ID=447022 ORGANISM="Scrippsiella hangoei-like, Strain SHHI-4" /NCGR_SAMPLE_ID=MMETSP0369 /ASSEMBLY_ACC=CAM_ASM_000364 /LENGTH=161 /DNA_ID=CAMNT_0018956473 /DNA_START=103 /DNA_END=584 /DNA_ORIENTATION=-
MTPSQPPEGHRNSVACRQRVASVPLHAWPDAVAPSPARLPGEHVGGPVFQQQLQGNDFGFLLAGRGRSGAAARACGRSELHDNGGAQTQSNDDVVERRPVHMRRDALRVLGVAIHDGLVKAIDLWNVPRDPQPAQRRCGRRWHGLGLSRAAAALAAGAVRG